MPMAEERDDQNNETPDRLNHMMKTKDRILFVFAITADDDDVPNIYIYIYNIYIYIYINRYMPGRFGCAQI